MNADEITGELIHIELRRRRMTQVQLGALLGITQAAASRKLYGVRSWTIDELLTVARYFGVPVTDLMPSSDYQPAIAGRGRSIEYTPRDSNPEPADSESERLLFWQLVAQLQHVAHE